MNLFGRYQLMNCWCSARRQLLLYLLSTSLCRQPISSVHTHLPHFFYSVYCFCFFILFLFTIPLIASINKYSLLVQWSVQFLFLFSTKSIIFHVSFILLRISSFFNFSCLDIPSHPLPYPHFRNLCLILVLFFQWSCFCYLECHTSHQTPCKFKHLKSKFNLGLVNLLFLLNTSLTITILTSIWTLSLSAVLCNREI